ncbi:MAG TPA: M28 family peptidase [Flavobacteriales bacterium]|nr:M28 family peptidase [Flavobacteriales bacterium]
MKLRSIVLITVLFSSQLGAQNWFDPKLIVKHISVLASDSLRGRGTGTEDERNAADYVIAQWKAAGIKPKGEKDSWFQEFDFNAGMHGKGGRSGKTNNIIGFLDNKAATTIIIGAHMDHLGDGSDGHSLDAHAKGQIHNGADDNASGTTGVIELARFYGMNKETEKFNFLFICFSGEELGLLGSEYYANHPTIDLAHVNCMINMDMIGRLKTDKPVLEVSGVGTAAEWMDMVKSFSSAAMEIKCDSAGVGPSDHTSFYNKQIPVLHFFTGTHSDYHKPSDDVEKINAQGEEAVLMVISGVIAKLPTDHKLAFLKTRNPSMGSASAFKVTLGIMPSYAEDAAGLKVEAVLDDKAAFKAGMKDGDIITQMGDIKVTGIQSYMEGLGKFSKGDKTKVTVLRGKETLVLDVEF